MHNLSRIAVTAAAAGLAVTACGGSSDALQGKTPQQIVTLASTSVTSNAYHMAFHGTLAIDTSGIQGLPPQALGQFGSMLQDVTVDGSGDVASAQRMRLTMTLKPLVDKQIVVVLYDGGVFVSMDGGTTFADGGSFNFNGLPVSPGDVAAILKDLGPVQDQGSTTKNGDSVEKLHAAIGNDFISKVLEQAGGSGNAQMQQVLQLVSQAMTVQSGAVDLYVRRSDGRLGAEDTSASLAIDMAKLMQVLAQAFGGQLPLGDASGVSGQMIVKDAVTSTFSDYGEKVSITKPTVDPNAPSLPSGGLFGA